MHHGANQSRSWHLYTDSNKYVFTGNKIVDRGSFRSVSCLRCSNREISVAADLSACLRELCDGFKVFVGDDGVAAVPVNVHSWCCFLYACCCMQHNYYLDGREWMWTAGDFVRMPWVSFGGLSVLLYLWVLIAMRLAENCYILFTLLYLGYIVIDDARAVNKWSGDGGAQRRCSLCDDLLGAASDNDAPSFCVLYRCREKSTIVWGNWRLSFYQFWVMQTSHPVTVTLTGHPDAFKDTWSLRKVLYTTHTSNWETTGCQSQFPFSVKRDGSISLLLWHMWILGWITTN